MNTAVEAGKRCCKCGKVRGISAFSRNRKTKDGRQHFCKECQSAYHREWYGTERGKASINAAWTRRAANPEHQKRFLARRMALHAKAQGRIPTATHCDNCGRGNVKLEHHHYLGYEREHWYDVKSLCDRCHTLAHEQE